MSCQLASDFCIETFTPADFSQARLTECLLQVDVWGMAGSRAYKLKAGVFSASCTLSQASRVAVSMHGSFAAGFELTVILPLYRPSGLFGIYVDEKISKAWVERIA